MEQIRISQPAQGSRIYQSSGGTVLFAQPPEVLKGLLLNDIDSFDTLVLPDIKEKDGSLTNSLEFPLYFFLFVSNGLEQGRRLNLVGDSADLTHALRLLRFALVGPTRSELEQWHADQALANDWLRASDLLALKDAAGKIISVENFFNLIPFENGIARVGALTINHLGVDLFRVDQDSKQDLIDLNEDQHINPPYRVEPDYVPGGLVKMGIEVLGGASGFSPNDPCTGIALCYNGEYILIDAIPFLDQHLFARGISKNQIAAIFLTHLHDDHCSMFPLMQMPHRVDVITTKEIFTMAMEKLACGLGWNIEVVEQHFQLVEVEAGRKLNYYGLGIVPHVTVHSIPTIGATFSSSHNGLERQMCVIGDNHTMTAIRAMGAEGDIRQSTVENLERLYSDRFSLLVADGGAGAIHGDPEDAIKSESERVVFVHVDELPNSFNTTFSLASSGKRYTLIQGDPAIYTSQINHYLTMWLGQPFPNRWMRSLLAEEEVKRFNTDDVILVQNQQTRGLVYLILTGYCDVVVHNGTSLQTVANLQAGDLMGEMAVITGAGTRNASVVARTPVTICVFAEETFRSFIDTEGFREKLLLQWSLRPTVAALPQFAGLVSTVADKIGQVARFTEIAPGEQLEIDSSCWHILCEGTARLDNEPLDHGNECGEIPFGKNRTGIVSSADGCSFFSISSADIQSLLLGVPVLNYSLRKLRDKSSEHRNDWQLGPVDLY